MFIFIGWYYFSQLRSIKDFNRMVVRCPLFGLSFERLSHAFSEGRVHMTRCLIITRNLVPLCQFINVAACFWCKAIEALPALLTKPFDDL